MKCSAFIHILLLLLPYPIQNLYHVEVAIRGKSVRQKICDFINAIDNEEVSRPKLQIIYSEPRNMEEGKYKWVKFGGKVYSPHAVCEQWTSAGLKLGEP
jgi:hypothetical protein